jgi:hypothetical protein
MTSGGCENLSGNERFDATFGDPPMMRMMLQSNHSRKKAILTSSLPGIRQRGRLHRRGRQVRYGERVVEPGEWQFRAIRMTQGFDPRYPSLE